MPYHHEASARKGRDYANLARLDDEGQWALHLYTIRIDRSGDMAIEFGGYSLSIRRDNEPQTSDRGKYIAAWRRFGQWRIPAALGGAPTLNRRMTVAETAKRGFYNRSLQTHCRS